MSGHRGEVVREVLDERKRQIALGWTEAHDDEHRTYDFGRFINQRTFKIMAGHAEERRLLIEVAALAVAAVESLDRRDV